MLAKVCHHKASDAVVLMGTLTISEYEALFPMGFHDLSLAEVRKQCADAFPLSKTRQEIVDGLEKVVDLLHKAKIKGSLWIDGGFATKKIDPGDADVVLVSEGPAYDAGDQKYRTAIDLMISNLKEIMKCDTYVLLTYPEGHDLFTQYEWDRGWYLGRWGWSESLEAKGIVRVALDSEASA